MALRCCVLTSGLLLAFATPPGSTAEEQVVLNMSGRAVTVAQVLVSLDADRNGMISRGEFLGWSLGASAGRYVGGILDAFPGGVEEFFGFADRDGSNALDQTELSQLAALLPSGDATRAENQTRGLRLRARAAAGAASARRLDEATEYKEGHPDANPSDDARCKAPKGYPTDPDGWLCVDETSPIYCHKQQRWGELEECEWKGECRAGAFGQAGCNYPLCAAVPWGEQACLRDMIYLCESSYSHGRSESHPVVSQKCSEGSMCKAYSDGQPPTRRRRTTNCHKECDDDGCRAVCHEDPPDPPYVACVKESCHLLETAEPSYVRSCITE